MPAPNLAIMAKTQACFPYLAARKNAYPEILRRYKIREIRGRGFAFFPELAGVKDVGNHQRQVIILIKLL
jgi:hypothetical protein